MWVHPAAHLATIDIAEFSHGSLVAPHSTSTSRSHGGCLTALEQQVLDVPQAEREPHIHHYDQTDDFG